MKKKEASPATTLTDADVHDRVVQLFSALLHWDLRLSFQTSPDGMVYTVCDRDGTGILVRVNRKALEGWVRQRLLIDIERLRRQLDEFAADVLDLVERIEGCDG